MEVRGLRDCDRLLRPGHSLSNATALTATATTDHVTRFGRGRGVDVHIRNRGDGRSWRGGE
jgi:hypothetical protein